MLCVHSGPDLIICDEGHVLKNDSTGLSKATNQMKSRRRIVLTGTPLQNNLIECKCCHYYLLHWSLCDRAMFICRHLWYWQNKLHVYVWKSLVIFTSS